MPSTWMCTLAYQSSAFVNSDTIWLPLFTSKTPYVQVPSRHNQQYIQKGT